MGHVISPGPSVSVVIPAFNEATVIGHTLCDVARHFAALGTPLEVLVADDGSTDATVAIAMRTAADGLPVRVIRGAHRGKGAAVRTGMLAAIGQWILFMDADHATPIDQWQRFAPLLATGAPIVIGSRKVPGADILQRQPAWREAAGRAFTWLANRILATDVSDFTCGFKAFQQDVARAIFSQQRVDGWGFDAEILFLAHRLGLPVREVPVVWRDDANTRVRIARDAVRSFSELLAIRWAAWRGHYPQAAVDVASAATQPAGSRVPRV